MKKLIIRRDYVVVLFLLLLIPFVKPTGIAAYPVINRIFQTWKIVTLFLSIILIIHFSKFRIVMDNIVRGYIGLVIFEAIYLFNAVYYGNPFLDLLNNCFTNIILLCLIYFSSKSIYRKKFVTAVNILFSIELLLHVCSVCLAENGYPLFNEIGNIGNTYLFGRDNYSAFTTLPMLGIVLYTDRLLAGSKIRKIKGYILCISLLLCYLSTDSATAMVVFFIMALLTILSRVGKKIIALLSPRKVLFIITIFLISIICFGIEKYFAAFLSTAFDKGAAGVTLNSRTIIWKMAFGMILQKPLFGWGILSSQQINNYVLYGTEHAHNLVLELLLRTGSVGTISYFFFLCCSAKNWKQKLKTQSNILLATLFCFLLLSIMDFYPLLQAQVFLVGMIYCSNNFEKDLLYSEKENYILRNSGGGKSELWRN